MSRLEEVWWDGKKRYIQVRKRAQKSSKKEPLLKASICDGKRPYMQTRKIYIIYWNSFAVFNDYRKIALQMSPLSPYKTGILKPSQPGYPALKP